MNNPTIIPAVLGWIRSKDFLVLKRLYGSTAWVLISTDYVKREMCVTLANAPIDEVLS
jgi:hypothetical protein